MKFRLMPRENAFFLLLESLADKAEEAVKVFKRLLDEWNPSHPAIQELRDLEHACDKLVHEIMIKLNKTFVTPIDREDIHSLSKQIDDLVDILHSLCERMILFRVDVVKDELKAMTMVLQQAVAIVVLTIHKIKNLKNSQELLNYCVQVNALENQGDRIFERALGELFHNSPNPIEVIKWKEIYDFLERAIDKCEDIADIVWGIVVKYG